MIAFGTCVGTPSVYSRYAAAGLRRVAEPDSVFAEVTTDQSIHEAYNEVLEHFATVPDLEGLVLLHEDTELLDPDFCTHVRSVLSDPAVAIAGAIGARNVTELSWWNGEIAGRVRESRTIVDGGFENVDVDTVDGLILILSPWAVRNLRCDVETFTGFHAYDADLYFQARSSGRRVVVTELSLFHHTTGNPLTIGFAATDAAFRKKWRLPPFDSPQEHDASTSRVFHERTRHGMLTDPKPPRAA